MRQIPFRAAGGILRRLVEVHSAVIASPLAVDTAHHGDVVDRARPHEIHRATVREQLPTGDSRRRIEADTHRGEADAFAAARYARSSEPCLVADNRIVSAPVSDTLARTRKLRADDP